MEKISMQQIGDRAFIDELEKVGFPTDAVKTLGTSALKGLRGAAGTLGQSFKNLAGGAQTAAGHAMSAMKGPAGNTFSNATRGEHMTAMANTLKETAGKSKAALGVLGGAGALGTGMAIGGSGKKKD